MKHRVHPLAWTLRATLLSSLTLLSFGARAAEATHPEGANRASATPLGVSVAPAPDATTAVTPNPTAAPQPQSRTPAAVLQEWREATEAYRRSLTAVDGDREDSSAPVTSLGTAKSEVSGFASSGLLAKLTAEVSNLETLMAETSKWEEQMALGTASGRANGILARADAFTVERQYRRKVEASAQSLARLVQQVLAMQAEAAKNDMARIDELRAMLAMAPGSIPSTAPAPSKPDLASFEYYEVKMEADLKQISALQEVYGDATQWEALYQANRSKIADPAAPLPKGTLLVVPSRHKNGEGNL